MAERWDRLQHRSQLAHGGLQIFHLSRVEQTDSETCKIKGQKLGQFGSGSCQCPLLHWRCWQCSNVVIQFVPRRLETVVR